MTDRATQETDLDRYQEKFALLNQRMRWEVADILHDLNWERASRLSGLVDPTDSFYSRTGKRVLDVLGSSVALLASLPINLAILAGTAVTVGRPVIFKQRRLGKGGVEFTLYKPRTMHEEADDEGRPILGEHRVTKFGRLVRRTSMDELLNFWSVLRGDMSLIGPRPLVPEYLDRFTPRHRQRLAVKPGLYCPSPHRGETLDGYGEQFENDVWYVSNVSLRTDLKLMLRTVEALFDRKSSSARASSKRGSFMGYDAHGEVITSNQIPIEILDQVLENNASSGGLDSYGSQGRSRR